MASFAHRRAFGKPEPNAVLATLTAQWTPDQIQGACHACGHVWRDGFWTPLETIWTFLWQVLHAGSACREAVASALAQRSGTGHARRPSPDPSAYCQARQRLPWAVLEAGVRTLGARLEAAVATVRTWCGRRVRVVDGSRVSMPDTPGLQAAFGHGIRGTPYAIIRNCCVFGRAGVG